MAIISEDKEIKINKLLIACIVNQKEKWKKHKQ